MRNGCLGEEGGGIGLVLREHIVERALRAGLVALNQRDPARKQEAMLIFGVDRACANRILLRPLEVSSCYRCLGVRHNQLSRIGIGGKALFQRIGSQLRVAKLRVRICCECKTAPRRPHIAQGVER